MAADLRELDDAFELPDTVTDTKLRSLYEVIVARMRDEAKHLPMNTVQQLLIERIALNYIVLRAREKGDLGGFSHATVQKDFNSFWLGMTQEFNRMLGKVDPMSGADRKAMLKEIQQIIVRTLSAALPDPKQRSDVMQRMASEFETAGI